MKPGGSLPHKYYFCLFFISTRMNTSGVNLNFLFFVMECRILYLTNCKTYGTRRFNSEFNIIFVYIIYPGMITSDVNIQRYFAMECRILAITNSMAYEPGGSIPHSLILFFFSFPPE